MAACTSSRTAMYFWQGFTFLVMSLFVYFVPPSTFLRHNPAAYMVSTFGNVSGTHNQATLGVTSKSSLVNGSADGVEQQTMEMSGGLDAYPKAAHFGNTSLLENQVQPPPKEKTRKLMRSPTDERLAACEGCFFSDGQDYNAFCKNARDTDEGCEYCVPGDDQVSDGVWRCWQVSSMWEMSPEEIDIERTVLNNAIVDFNCAHLEEQVREANKEVRIGGVLLVVGVVGSGVGVFEGAEGIEHLTKGMHQVSGTHHVAKEGVEAMKPLMPSHEGILYGVGPTNLTAQAIEARKAQNTAERRAIWRKRGILALNIVVYGLALALEAGVGGAAMGSVVATAHAIMMPLNIANTALGAVEFADEWQEREYLLTQLNAKCSKHALKSQEAFTKSIEYKVDLSLYFKGGD